MAREVICSHGLPVRPDEMFPREQSPYCRPCWVAMGGTGVAETVADCTYLGDRVRVAGSNRDWRTCGHPDQPLGPTVCRCKGCGPRCAGYPTN